jgi:tetratricopeptide (TPR) repeat protein
LTLSRKVNGPEDPDTLGAINSLALSYAEAGRRDEALKLREELLALRRKVNGPENPETLRAIQDLAVFYFNAGRQDEAVKLEEEALTLSRKLKGPEDPSTLRVMISLGNLYATTGHLEEALKLREEVLSLCRKVNGPEHRDTLSAMEGLADSYCAVGRGTEAIALLAKAFALDPKDTLASLNLGTLQAWLGLDADYEATRHRVVQQAEGTDEASTAERAAKAASLRPSTDAAVLTNALALAQRAVELGKSDPNLPWYQLGLGLAEYRTGQYADAERILTLAEQTAGEGQEIPGIARFYRVMSLFRQDKPEEARKLFSQAEAQMPPLPRDESKPLVDGKAVSHDVLICWLAYKEAKVLLNGSGAPRP